MISKCKILSIQEIKNDKKIINKMYTLMTDHYENINIDKFIKDLYIKDNIFLVYSSEELIGFSTLKKIKISLEEENETIIGLFSGDTVIKKGFSWSISFQKEWIKFCLEESEKNNLLNIKTYWFLISKGIKTYMYLPTYFKNYSPKLGVIESKKEKKIKELYGQKLYANRYDMKSGVIRNDSSNDYLKENVVSINSKQQLNRDIQFFISKNPNYKEGDELVCLAELSYENLTNLGKRVVKNLKL